jgi:hypothetical protein
LIGTDGELPMGDDEAIFKHYGSDTSRVLAVSSGTERRIG